VDKSPDGKIVEVGVSPLTRHFSIYGELIQDTVCMNGTGGCVSGFKFIGIANQDGINGFDGVLGLAPRGPGDGVGPSYISALKDSGLIDKKIVSLFLSRSTGSKLTFGGVL
jgi:hypothetical protein